MTRISWNHAVLGAVALPVLGVAFAAATVLLPGASGRAGMTIAYAIATLPLAAGLGAVGSYLCGRFPNGPSVSGASAALIGAVLAAMAAATIRFRQTGATGLVSLSALPYTAEFLMLVGIGPAVAALGAGLARRRRARGFRSVVGWSGAAGALSSALVGLVLIVVRGLGSLPFLNPVVLWLLLVAAIAWIGWRRIDPV